MKVAADIAAAGRNPEKYLLAALEWALTSTKRMCLTVFLVAATAFLLAAHYNSGQVSDTQAAIWPAWMFVHHGTFKLDHATGLPLNEWFVHLNGHLVSLRAMGVLLLGVPVCALLSWTHLSPADLNAITGALLSAGAITALAATFRRLATPRLALVATFIVGFGTSIWTVAGTETWPQTGDALFIALMLMAVADDRIWWAGIALAPTVLIRPHVALVAFIMGVGLAIQRRSPRPLFAFGVPSAFAFVLLLLWNHWMFGGWHPLGPYDSHVDTLTGANAPGVSAYVHNAAGAFFSPQQGLFLFTPLAALAIVWILYGLRQTPMWTRLALLGGLAYEALQLQLDIFTGGGPFYGSRLIIELVVVASPVAVASYPAWAVGHPKRRVTASVLAGVGVAIFTCGAALPSYLVSTTHHQLWHSYYPLRVLQAAGLRGLLIAVPVLACLVIVLIDRYRKIVRRGDTGHPDGLGANGSPATPLNLEASPA